ncbi:receptor-type tyrosine-protein phosphatase epsilon-like [Lytechinus variegatus]|uniref:receptor-type tyrosine-protein phosphatase epsilon-like n=1 Tax=Lytechinus variegatus TaxID=7654 RepID=UPI001BB10A45|nr:receptor-type tyrosine-protein phosphatase epsilon-like [Lytechinus variegatus]
MRASIGDFSTESFVTATSTDISDGSSLQSNFTLSIDDIETKTIYCFVGNSTSDEGLAYISLRPQGTFVLPVYNSQPRLAEQGYSYLVIAWDSWEPGDDVGDGPVIGYKVYVTSSDGNETVTSITASGVPRERESSRRRREDAEWMNSPMVGPPRILPSRKKRQGDAGTLMHNVTGLDDGQSYLIQISAVRDGLNGEGEKGPALSVTTREIEPPPGPSSTGAIVGGAVGGIIFIVLLIVIIIIVLRWRRKPRPKPVSYSYDNDYIGGISTEDETGKSDTPKSTDTLKSTPNVTPRKPVVRPKPSIAAELRVTSNGVDHADVPVSRSEEAPKERHPIPISQFATLVQNNRYTDMFYEEFHCLPEANIFPQTVAKKKINFEKNRYKNILPYDSSRVVLPIINGDPESHYFNASFLPSFGNEHAYIASQGPNNASMIDFWRLVWKENVKTIAMVTNLQEGNKIKCRQYWPESKSVTFGDIFVNLESVTNCTGGLKRTMFMKRGADTKVVNQFHFTQWPDKAVPSSTSVLLRFIDEVQKDHSQNDSPLLVHCSAGVGRTGVVLSIDSVVAEAKRTNQVDIFGYVSKMRQHRPYMVQTQEQYKFVYIAVLEALLSENTRIQACYFESALMKLQVVTRNKKGMSTLLGKQFQNLTIVCPDPPAAMVRTGTQAENRSKSRYANILPLERNRVILQSKSSSDSDFINASFVRGLRYGFITTQMPMPNTVGDFWSMVIDYQPAIIVMLNDDSRDKSCAQYWFDNSVTTFGSVSVTTLSVCEREGFIIRELQATRDNSQVCHVVKQYQFLEWPTKAKQQRDRAKSLLDFIGEVEDSFSDISEEFPVVVHCLNGVGRTGVFCTTLECIKQLNTEDAVDIFQMVKMLRNERTHFVQTEEEYTFIHELINEYLHENDYEQLPVPVEDDEHTYGNVESTAAPDVTGEGVYEIASIQDGAGNRPVSYRNLAGIDGRQSVAAAEQTSTEERTAQPPRDDVYENVNYR